MIEKSAYEFTYHNVCVTSLFNAYARLYNHCFRWRFRCPQILSMR